MSYTAHFQSVVPSGAYQLLTYSIRIEYRYSNKTEDELANKSQNKLLKHSEFTGAGKLCKRMEDCGIFIRNYINSETDDKYFFAEENGTDFLNGKYIKFDTVLFAAAKKLQLQYRLPFFKKDLEQDKQVSIANGLILRDDVYEHSVEHHRKIKNAYDFLVKLSYILCKPVPKMSHTVLEKSDLFYELHWESFNLKSVKILVCANDVYTVGKKDKYLVSSLIEHEDIANVFRLF